MSKENESPTLETQIVAVKKASSKPKKTAGPLSTKQAEKRKEALIEHLARLNDEEVSLDSLVEEFKREKVRLEKSLREVGVNRKRELVQIRKDNPGISNEGLKDKVHKSRRTKTSQLLANIQDAKDCNEIYQHQKIEVTLEIRRVSGEIKDLEVNEQVRVVGDAFGVWLDAFKKAEALFDALKESVRAVDAPRFEQRFVSLGFPRSYAPVFDSFINQSNLNSLNMNQLSIMLGDLGDSYGEVLLPKRMDRQTDIPLQREEFLARPAMFGRV